VLILSKARQSRRLGRFRIDFDDFAKLVTVTPISGPAPSREERRNIEKWIRVVRPEVLREHIHTGWAIESSIDIAI